MAAVDILTIVVIVAIMESHCRSLHRHVLRTVQCHELLKLLLFLVASYSSAAG
jgi:hypothetical protein